MNELSFPLHRAVIHRSDIKPNVRFTGNQAQGMTIHMTGNRSPGADAAAHQRYLATNRDVGKKSWHTTVDDRVAYQHLRWDEQAWHAGDGAGPGNTTTIGLEICMFEGIDQRKAYENAAELTAWLIATGRAERMVKQHHDWSGKDCPELIRRDGLWPWFVGRVADYIDGKGDAMTAEQLERLERLERIIGGYGVRVSERKDDGHTKLKVLTGEEALEYLDREVNFSVALMTDNLNRALSSHLGEHPVGEHGHVVGRVVSIPPLEE